MIYYEIEYRQDGEQMLHSETFETIESAEVAFENAKFKEFSRVQCDVIELWQYWENKPSFEGVLLGSKELK